MDSVVAFISDLLKKCKDNQELALKYGLFTQHALTICFLIIQTGADFYYALASVFVLLLDFYYLFMIQRVEIVNNNVVEGEETNIIGDHLPRPVYVRRWSSSPPPSDERIRQTSESCCSCSICLDDFDEELESHAEEAAIREKEKKEERPQQRVLPMCGHRFHIQCIDSWITRIPICPNCRRYAYASSSDRSSSLSNMAAQQAS